MENGNKEFCLLVLPSITKALYNIGEQNEALGFKAFKMLNEYARNGTKPTKENLVLSVLFDSVAPNIDNYKTKVEKLRANGKKGGRPRTTQKERTNKEKCENILTKEEQEKAFKEIVSDNEFYNAVKTRFAPYFKDEDFNTFYTEVNAKNNLHKNKDDIKRHFFEWERIQCEKRENKRPREQTKEEREKEWIDYAQRKLYQGDDVRKLPTMLRENIQKTE